MDEEARVEVVQRRARRRSRAAAATRAAAPSTSRASCGAGRVVADERHAPVGQHAAGRGLGGVVQQRGEAHRLAARELVRERLGEQRARPRRRAPRPPGRAAAARPRRAPRACGRGRRDGGTGSARPRAAPSARAARHRSARTRPSAPGRRATASAETTRLSSANTRSGATPRSPGAFARDRGAGRRVELEVELDGDPDRRAGCAAGPPPARRAQTIRTSRALEVRAPAVRVEQLAAAERLGHRVDREVALRRGRPGCRRPT